MLRVNAFVLAALLVAPAVQAQAPPSRVEAVEPPLDPLRSTRRIVHQFDFDERDAGNLEEVPMFWGPIRTDGFPRFTQGAFDFDTGHTAPPSFHLKSTGRSVAYLYSGPATRVRTNSDYRIVGYVRPDNLLHARACLSAHYLDRVGRAVTGTLVRSRWVGGTQERSGWVEVELFLPAAPAHAHSIAVAVWVTQEPIWNTDPQLRRHIQHTDVQGGAWFDDITIHALPRIGLASSVLGNVLTSEHPQNLIVTLADEEDSTLNGKLTVSSAVGGEVLSLPVPVATEPTEPPFEVAVGQLPAGLYRVRLEVQDGVAQVATAELTFARLAALGAEDDLTARPFGVVLDPRRRSSAEAELSLLHQQVARSAKIPVWSGQADEEPTRRELRARDRMLQDLVRANFALVGVLVGPPAAMLQRDGAYPRSLVEVLTGDPSMWQDQLAKVVAPYAGVFRYWQVGADADLNVTEDPELGSALNGLRGVMRAFLTSPLLAAPDSNLAVGTRKLPVEKLTLALGPEVGEEWIAEQLANRREVKYGHLAVYLEPLPAGRYQRLPRLAQWARRVIRARHAGADTVYVPQTWNVRQTARGQITEPTEEYIVYRTIAALLGDAVGGGTLRAEPGVAALAFNSGSNTVLALWDEEAPPEGRVHALQLGRATRQVDLWGEATPLTRDAEGRHLVRLSAEPVFVDGVERWLVDFRQTVSLTPDHLEYGREPEVQAIELAARTAQPVSGSVQLEVPKDWEVQPRDFSFHLMGNRASEVPVLLRAPYSEAAGVKEVIAHITLTGSDYYLRVPLPVTLDLSDVQVSALALVEGETLLLRHTVKNLSQQPLSFRGSASVPGRERQYRPFTNLMPGDSQQVVYRFTGAGKLTGRKVRLVLRELADGPRLHNLEVVVP